MAVHRQENVSQHAVRNILTRDFVLGFFAFFTYMFAAFALIPTLPIYLAGLGTNDAEIGILVGIFSISALISRFLAGGALSRYSEKSVMVFAALLFAITFPACIVFRPFWPFLVLRLFQGFAYACLDTAAFALIIKITPGTHRGRVLGYFMLAPGLATAMAPSFGMFLVNQFSFTILFLYCTAISMCTLFFTCALKSPGTAIHDTGAPAHDAFFLERKIVIPAVSAGFYNFTLGSVGAFFPLYAIQCGVLNPGYFFSFAAIMTIAGRVLGGKIQDTWSKERIILTFTLSSMAAMVILSFSQTLPMFIFVGLIWGTGVAFIFPVSMAYGLEYAGSSGGAAVGTFRAITDLGMALGPMIMGIIVPFTGYPGLFFCLAFICLINLCYFQFFVRKKHHAAPAV